MLAEVFSHGDGEAINLIYAELSHAFISPLTQFPLTPLADLMTESCKVTFETYTLKITWNKVSINPKQGKEGNKNERDRVTTVILC